MYIKVIFSFYLMNLPKSLHIVLPIYNPTDEQSVLVVIRPFIKICRKQSVKMETYIISKHCILKNIYVRKCRFLATFGTLRHWYPHARHSGVNGSEECPVPAFVCHQHYVSCACSIVSLLYNCYNLQKIYMFQDENFKQSNFFLD